MALHLSGTLKAWDAATGMATIDFEGTVAQGAADKEPDEGDMQAQMAAMVKIKESKVSGRMVFDVRRGRLVGSKTVMSMAMENPMGDMTTEVTADLALIP